MYVVLHSNGICEGFGEEAPFETKKGPYLECHQLHRLCDGGPDHPKNVTALCPNCHTRAHYAISARSFKDELLSKVAQLEENNDSAKLA